MPVLERRFKKRLIDLGMKQKDVADHFGWSSTYVRQLVGGATLGPAAEENLKKVKDFVGMK